VLVYSLEGHAGRYNIHARPNDGQIAVNPLHHDCRETGASSRPSAPWARSSTCGSRARATPIANIQAVLAPAGFPLWVSDVEPGSVYDTTAVRIHSCPPCTRPPAADLSALADPGYDGTGTGIHIPPPAGDCESDINARIRNALLRSLRCLGERGFGLLTSHWRTLQHITASPTKSAAWPAPRSSSPISNTVTSHEFH